MKLHDIFEAPLAHYGDSNYDASVHGRPAGMPSFHPRLSKQLSGTSVPINVILASRGDTKRREWGRMQPGEIDVPNEESSVNFAIIGPSYAPEKGFRNEIPLTPWMVAHRLGHALVQNESTTYALYARIAKFGEFRWMKHLTTKSARNEQLNKGEEMPELFAQYMLKGKIRLSDELHRTDSQYAKSVEEEFNQWFEKILKKNVGKTLYTK